MTHVCRTTNACALFIQNVGVVGVDTKGTTGFGKTTADVVANILRDCFDRQHEHNERTAADRAARSLSERPLLERRFTDTEAELTEIDQELAVLRAGGTDSSPAAVGAIAAMAARRAGKASRLLALVRDLDRLDAQCRDDDRSMMVFAPTQTAADNMKTMLSTRLNRGEENTVVLVVTGRDTAAMKKHVLQEMAKEKAELAPGVPVRSVTVATAVYATGVNVNCFAVVTIGCHTVAAAVQMLNRTARGGELERTAAWIVCGRLMFEKAWLVYARDAAAANTALRNATDTNHGQLAIAARAADDRVASLHLFWRLVNGSAGTCIVKLMSDHIDPHCQVNDCPTSTPAEVNIACGYCQANAQTDANITRNKHALRHVELGGAGTAAAMLQPAVADALRKHFFTKSPRTKDEVLKCIESVDMLVAEHARVNRRHADGGPHRTLDLLVQHGLVEQFVYWPKVAPVIGRGTNRASGSNQKASSAAPRKPASTPASLRYRLGDLGTADEATRRWKYNSVMTVEQQLALRQHVRREALGVEADATDCDPDVAEKGAEQAAEAIRAMVIDPAPEERAPGSAIGVEQTPAEAAPPECDPDAAEQGGAQGAEASPAAEAPMDVGGGVEERAPGSPDPLSKRKDRPERNPFASPVRRPNTGSSKRHQQLGPTTRRTSGRVSGNN